MKTIGRFVLASVVSVTVLWGCSDLTEPDFNNPSITEVTEDPTRPAIISVATGLLIGTRVDAARTNGYISLLGIIGRESYNFDGADPRFVTQMLSGPLTNNAPRFGGNLWASPYRNIQNANLLLDAVDQIGTDPTAGFSATEKEAIRGFAKTIQALDFLTVVNTRDTNCGCAIDTQDGIFEPAPEATKSEVFAHIVSLLDEAKNHLESGGGSFPFPLSPGFAGFDSPSSFLTFNRALKARVDVYMMNYNQALQSLGESFINAGGSLDLGVYQAYSTGPGDITNELFDPGETRNIRAHPSVATDAELKTNGSPDDRFTRKVQTISPRTFLDLTSDLGFQLYASNQASVPIIRNEELILLRAEANIGLGNLGPAEADINLIRATSGGLPAVTLSTAQQALDQLLYEKQYSLLFEGGHRWIDMRRYGRLDQLPLDMPGWPPPHPAFPIPIAEVNARN